MCVSAELRLHGALVSAAKVMRSPVVLALLITATQMVEGGKMQLGQNATEIKWYL